MSEIPSLSIDHFGIYVVDLDKMVEFYERVMGFTLTDRGLTPSGTEMAFMSRSPDKHHQIVLAGGRPKDTPSQINQISFRVETLSDLRNFNSTLQEEGSIDSLIQTTHGVSWSLYFNDPEGNRTEIFVETPWYTPAPRGMSLNLELSDQEIFDMTEKMLSVHPEFKTRANWRENAAERMGLKETSSLD
jgi:catechol 2,3-dioxygenase